MKELIEKAGQKKVIEAAEDVAKRVEAELKDAKVRRVSRGIEELYIDAGNDEASVTFDPKRKQAYVRIAIVRDTDMTGKAIADVLKKHGVL